ncbi:MAG: hypothetical protein V3U82_04140 [Robiginitomaculum sp.]
MNNTPRHHSYEYLGLGLCLSMFAIWAISLIGNLAGHAGYGMGVADAQDSFIAALQYWGAQSFAWLIDFAAKAL